MDCKISSISHTLETLYVGTTKGLFLVRDPEKPALPTRFKHNVVTVEAIDGKPLVSTRYEGKLQLFLDADPPNNAVFTNAVRHIATDNVACYVWNPTDRIVFRLVDDKGSLPFSLTPVTETTKDAHSRALILNQCTLLTQIDGRLYYTTLIGKEHHLFKLDLKTSNAELLFRDTGAFAQVTLDTKAGVWIASSNGLFHLPVNGISRRPIRDRSVSAVLVDGDRLFFATNNELRWFFGLEQKPWKPRIHLVRNLGFPGFLWPNASREYLELRVSEIDCDGRTFPEYFDPPPRVLDANQEENKSFKFRHDATGLSIYSEELPFGRSVVYVKITDAVGVDGTSDGLEIWAVPNSAKASVIAVFAILIFVFVHRPLLGLLRAMDWEVWHMADYLRIEANLSAEGWRFETQIYNEFRSKSAEDLHDDLAKAHYRSFRLITTANPNTIGSLVESYKALRGEQASSKKQPDFDPIFGAIAIQAGESSSVEGVKKEITGKPQGRLVFAQINHFNDANFGVLRRLRWHRLSSWILHAFGLIRPRHIMDAISDPIRGFAGATCIGNTGGEEAAAEDFFKALANADVIHVLAHGDSDRLNELGVTAHSLSEFLTKSEKALRARLVVFSSCKVGRELIVPLVQRGAIAKSCG
jgi:hypothetical protein